MSQPSSNEQCPITPTLSNVRLSQILPFLYVGSQEDALSIQIMQDNHITDVINVSKTGEKVAFLDENDSEHFLRIPINDCLNAQLLPYFHKTYRFIEKVRVNNGRVLIHCLAGISRSPTLAIAYIMRYLHLSADNAYQYVKQRRSQISPNFNFLGQLSEYEHNLSLVSESTSPDIPIVKCLTIETPFNDRRHFVQVEGSSNVDNSITYRTNVLSRPTCLSLNVNNNPSSLSTTGNSSVDTSRQRGSLTLNIPHPKSISTKYSTPLVECPTGGLINSTCDDLTKTKPVEKRLKSANTETDLINTYFQESTIVSKSSQQCKSSQQSVDVINESTPPPTTNVLNSRLKLLVS